MIRLADLVNITYSVTHHCNLACSWCFVVASAKLPFEFDLEFRSRLIERIGSKARHLTLTGGEPFTYPGILPLLETALNHFGTVGVTTNGVKLTAAQIDFVQRHHITLAISVDGPEPIHDAVRGRGTFQRVKKNAQLLVELGVPIVVQITLSRSLLPQLEACVAEVAAWDVRLITFQRLQALGRGATMSDEQLTIAEAFQVAQRLMAIIQNYEGQLKIKTKDPLHRTLNPRLQAQAAANRQAVLGGCRAAMSYLFIEVDGTVLPCPHLPLSVGNVMQQPLEEIWLQAPLLKQLRKRSAYRVCATCTNWNICRGCRADALLNCGDVMGRDPACWNSISADNPACVAA